MSSAAWLWRRSWNRNPSRPAFLLLGAISCDEGGSVKDCSPLSSEYRAVTDLLVPDISKIRSLGWEPQQNLELTFRSTMNSYLGATNAAGS